MNGGFQGMHTASPPTYRTEAQGVGWWGWFRKAGRARTVSEAGEGAVTALGAGPEARWVHLSWENLSDVYYLKVKRAASRADVLLTRRSASRRRGP